MVLYQQYSVFPVCMPQLGLIWGLGWWESWAVHGLVHGWCMGAWRWWCVRGVINYVLYYLGLELGEEDWWWLNLIIGGVLMFCHFKGPPISTTPSPSNYTAALCIFFDLNRIRSCLCPKLSVTCMGHTSQEKG